MPSSATSALTATNAPTWPVRILGIDPGSRMTGVGVVDATPSQVRHVAHECIKTRGDFPDRLKTIFDGLTAVIHEFRPDEVAIEDVFMSRNAGSALKLGQARGAAVCAAVATSLPVATYAPRLVKQAVVGKGSADKIQVQHMIGVLLSLREKLQADAADALGIAVCHAHSRSLAAR